MYCNNPDYKGVRMYCKQTCSSCGEDFSSVEDAAPTNGADGQGNDGFYNVYYMTSYLNDSYTTFYI